MQVHYLSGNPKKKVAKKTTKRISKKKNPHIETFSKGNDRKTVKRYELGEVQKLDRAVGKVSATKKKIDSMSAKGKGKAGKIASKKIKGMSKSADRFLYGLQMEREEAKRSGTKAMQLTAQGYKKTGSKFQPLNKMSSDENIKKFTEKLEKGAKNIASGKFAKKIGSKMSSQKRSHKAKVASEKRAKNLAEKNSMIESLNKKISSQKEQMKKLKYLQTHGASEADKNELKLLKEELKQTLSQLKGVSMAKKKKKSVKKVAKKATKKVAKKATKKATKKVAKKATKKAIKAKAKPRSRGKGRGKGKAKKVEVVAVVKKAVKAKGKGKGKGKGRGKGKTKRNPYITSNPIMKFASNPAMAVTALDKKLESMLGLKTGVLEIAGVVGVTAFEGMIDNTLRKIPVINTAIAKIEETVPAIAPAVPSLMSALLLHGIHFASKKFAKKDLPFVQELGNGALMLATVRLGEVVAGKVNSAMGLNGYVTDASPRSMGAYVMDRQIGSLPRANTDFQGVDFEGVDFGNDTINGEDEDEKADFGSDVVSIQGLGGEW